MHMYSIHTWCMMCAHMASYQVPILASSDTYTSWHPCHDVLICVDYTAVDVRHAHVQHIDVVYSIHTWCMMCAHMASSQVPFLASSDRYTSWHPCHDVLICVDYTAVDVRHAHVQHTHVVYDVCTYGVIPSANSGVIRHIHKLASMP